MDFLREWLCINRIAKRFLGGSVMKFDTIEAAIEDIRLGKMIVVVDDEDRKTKEIF